MILIIFPPLVEITRLEKEVRKLQKHHEEELICFSKRITCIEQEKDAVKKVMENLTRRPDNAAGTDRYALLEQIGTDRTGSWNR